MTSDNVCHIKSRDVGSDSCSRNYNLLLCPIPLSDLVGENQFRVGVDCRPQPEIANAFFRLAHASLGDSPRTATVRRR